ncbi:MAG TPA: alpha/beta hydrolase, partial [Steroidobacteraceae bacterium]|nr:alpha/beta hydrolase [Steroidobacteraceae bacterium]
MTLTLAADSRGTGGLPVLFAHSFAGDLTHWDAQLEHLSQQRRAVAFDFRGHGRSPGVVGRYSYDELAKDIGAIADAQELDRFVLVGHSMGAAIATKFAARHSRRVEALVLVDPPPAPGAVPAAQLQQIHEALEQDPYAVVEQFWNQQMFVDSLSDVQQRLLAGLRKTPRRVAIELTREAFAVDPSIPLRRFAGPKFAIVTPRNDTPLSLHRAVPGVEHVVVRGTGHWIQLDNPDAFNETLNGILKSV